MTKKIDRLLTINLCFLTLLVVITVVKFNPLTIVFTFEF